MSIENKESLLKRCLFIPCESKDALHVWIRVYLGLDLPNVIVSEESNSSPMDMIWELYSKARANDDESFSRIMAYATRGGFKTLSASVLEILMMLHLKRDVGHMAATKDQSDRSIEYVRNFLSRPFIRDFVDNNNKKRMEIIRYENAESKECLTIEEHALLDDETKKQYVRIMNFIQIVICSLQGANGLHSEFFAVDEIDTIDGDRVRGYRESKNIPKSRNGLMPITLLTSTRKFSYGLVQKELDNAHKTKLQVRHWNVIDILERCPPERHKPNEPTVDLYINDDTLEVVTPTELENLDVKTQSNFAKQTAFAGCVKCPLFSTCKTRLVNHQTSNSKMLSPIGELAAKFTDQSLEDVQTQLMCRKPSSAGLVYPRFNRLIHMKTATEIFEIIKHEPQTRQKTKQELIDYLLTTEAKFYSGIDFGFTHPFVVVTGFVWGNYCFVIDVISQSGLELDDKIAACARLKRLNPTVYADPEDPASAMTFSKKGGFHVRKWNKDKGSVKKGIESVRAKLKPAVGKPTLFFLKDDTGCELLATKLESYHFETDLAGEVSETPSKLGDDEMDALRYLVMNVFTNKGGIIAAVDSHSFITSQGPIGQAQPQQNLEKEMQTIINGFLSGSTTESLQESSTENAPKNSKFLWDISD